MKTLTSPETHRLIVDDEPNQVCGNGAKLEDCAASQSVINTIETNLDNNSPFMDGVKWRILFERRKRCSAEGCQSTCVPSITDIEPRQIELSYPDTAVFES